MKSLEEYIEEKKNNALEKKDDFVTYLYFLMDKYKIDKASTLYNKANISKQVFSLIISNKSNPSLQTCLKLVFALGLNNHESKYLLKKAGYTLPSCYEYNVIIRYCIENKLDLNTLNEYLEKYGYSDSLII